MSAAALLASLERLGIQLRVEGERLRFTAPQGAMTPELRAQLKARKAELISTLSGEESSHASAAPRIYPPSFVQRRFWTLQQRNPDQGFYNVPFVFRLQGPVDAAVLRHSFNDIVRRHESLRTTLRELSGQLMQVIAPSGGIHLSEVKLPDASEEVVAKALEAEMTRPFDLAREAGLRVLLLRLAPEEFILQLCFHNTIFDQSSVIVLLKELSQHYAARMSGAEAVIPEPAQYIEYVRWQESLMDAGMEERLNYWQEWFRRGDPPKWTWTPHKSAPANPGFHSHVTWLRLPPEVAQQIQSFSQSNGVTSYITLITAYAILLSRYTNCRDVTIGTTYSNRHDWRFASLIGATIDVPALRIDMTGDPLAIELLARVREVIAAALTHQDVPFDEVLPGRSRSPLFRVVCSYFAETAHGQLQLPGVEVTFIEEAINELSRPDLYLVVFNTRSSGPPGLTGYWMHKQDVFTADTAKRMNQEFQTLLSAIVNGPARSLSSLAAE